MSELGQQRRFAPVPTMSGLPLTADIAASIGTVAKGDKPPSNLQFFVQPGIPLNVNRPMSQD
jgi:hypothetical protein